MLERVQKYVLATSLVAGCAFAAIAFAQQQVSVRDFYAASCFAALGLFAYAFAYSRQSGTAGSIAFLPCITAVILSPTWVTCGALGIAVVIAEGFSRRPLIKAIFNVAQFVLTTSIASLAYRALGGEGLVNVASGKFDLSAVPALLGAGALFLGVNSLAVSGVMGVSQQVGIIAMWKRQGMGVLSYDMLTLPFVYVFARIYIENGFVGAAFLAIPLMGARQLYKANFLLERTNGEFLQLLIAAVEARDSYTSGHSRRVEQSARQIARDLGLSEREIERVARAALLHDVGKIHEIYEPILNKPSRLTEEERAVMETHPIKSAELVALVDYLRDLVPAVRHHHEAWDGSGYPDRLSGETIPFASRVIAIADTVDAMGSDRPYRPALPLAVVEAELMRQRGKQFDPAILDALVIKGTLMKLLGAAEQSRVTEVPTLPMAAQNATASA